MEVKHYAPGDIIFQQGQPSAFAYFLKSGEVRIRYQDESGKDAEKYFYEGTLFCEYGPIENVFQVCTAQALTEVSLEVLSKEDFATFYRQAAPEIQRLIDSLLEKAQDKKIAAPASVPSAPTAAAASPATAVPNGAPHDEFNRFSKTFSKLTDILSHQCEVLEHRMHSLEAHGGLNGTNGHAPIYTPSTYESTASAPVEKHDIDVRVAGEQLRGLTDLGPIQPLIEDASINDILINGPKSIFVERAGKLEKTDITFPSEESLLEVAYRIVRAIGRTIDPKRPLVDARLLDGSRVNIIAPPLAIDGTTISIRKFSEKKITLDTMVEHGNLSPQLGGFLKVVGKCRLNVLISGGTGTGKTTMLNAISRYISHDERIVTIEDAAELQLQQPHVVRLETKPLAPGVSIHEEVSMRDLVKNALRMRPDRIIVGECRGSEAFDMLQAMNTGHEGSLATVHANYPRDALTRLENMVSMANLSLNPKAIRNQIASAINIIIQISRLRDGSRKTMQVTEIVGMEGETITMQDLFLFTPDGEDADGKITGKFKWTGIMPRCIKRIAYFGELENLAKSLGVAVPKVDNK